MNILSNFLAQGAQNPAKNQDVNNLAVKADKQGMGQKFTQLMMGFLGMNSANTSAEAIDTPVPTEENAEQSLGESGDGKGKENEALAGLFIGSHFITVNTAQDQADATAESSETQSSDEQPVNKTTASVLKDLSAEGENVNVSSDEMKANKVQKNQSADKENNTGKTLKNIEETQDLTVDAETKNSNSTAEVQGAVNGKEKTSSSDQQNVAATSSKKAPAQTQSSAKNKPQSAVTSNIDPKIDPNPKKNLTPKAPKIQTDNGQAKQKQDAKTQPTSPVKTTTTQKAGEQKNADKKNPALKQLMNQAEEKLNLSAGKKAQTKAAQKMNADTKAHSSIRSELTQTAAGVTASGQDKASFKPLKQHSSSFELDPSKIVSVESGGSGDVEMDLQARSDGDTSANDDGKMSFRIGNSALSHLSNTNGRREFSTQLVRQLQQSETGKGEAAKNWNHHRFVMDDGKTLNVSVKHAQGAMHLQLGAGDAQLNKIIQQHIDEIRQHLQEQMNVEINLELQDFGGQQTGQENGDSQTKTQNAGNPLGIANGQTAANTNQAPARTTRYLGFNTNEWTA